MAYELSTLTNIYGNNFPNFGRPKVIGYFSLTGQRQYRADTSQLKFAREVVDKSVKYDLNLNINETILRTEDRNEKISHLLQFILDQEKRLNYSLVELLDHATFYCYRGLLTCVACTPYENREPWRIVATLHKGNIYLCALDTEQKTESLRNRTEKDQKFTTWGYKFEQFILSDLPNTDPNPNIPLNENEEFSLVFATNLNKHNIVYAAEVDGIRCDQQSVIAPPDTPDSSPDATVNYLRTQEFIELKTNRHIDNSKQSDSFRRFKTKKWWCQSFLAGIDTIECGFRNDYGIIEELKVYNIKELVKISEKFWNPNVCFNFLNSFLTYVKRSLDSEIKRKYSNESLKNIQTLPLISLHFEWSPRLPVRVTNNYNYKDDPILPDWFVNNYGNMK